MPISHRFFSRTPACLAALAALWLVTFPAHPARAHSVFIFAWVDGPQICTESYFTRNSKVRGGGVRMSDASGRVLAEGQSNEEGVICFPLPDAAQPLYFTVTAGSGHKADFQLAAGDIEEAVRLKKAFHDAADKNSPDVNKNNPDVAQNLGPKGNSPGAAQNTDAAQSFASNENSANAPQSPDSSRSNPKAPQNIAPGQGDRVEPAATAKNATDTSPATLGPAGTSAHLPADLEPVLRAIISQELQQQLSPIRRALAEQGQDASPRLRDIVGGIGWLLGLGALGQWYARRNRKG